MNRESYDPHESGKEINRERLNRRKYIVLLAAVVLVSGMAWAWLAKRDLEPRYQGRSLSAWLKAHFYSTSQPQRATAAAAVREIGTNTFLLLNVWVRSRPSTFSIYTSDVLDRLSWLMRVKPPMRPWERTWDAIECLGTNATPLLVQWLSDNDEALARSAAGWLCYIGSPEELVFPALTQALTDPRPGVRSAVISGLSRLAPGSDSVLLVITNAFTDPTPEVRHTIVEALEKFGSPGIPALNRAIKDPAPEVRWEAWSVLHKIAPTELTNTTVLTTAKLALRSPDSRMREWGAQALQPFGPEALIQAPELASMLQDSDSKVLMRVRNVLFHVAPEVLTNAPPR